MRIRLFLASILPIVALTVTVRAGELPIVNDSDLQPFSAEVPRLIEAMDLLGAPFSPLQKADLEAARQAKSVTDLQKVLDPHCLFGISINPEMRVKVAQGPAKPELVEQGWRQFLVKIANDPGTTAPLVVVSPNAASVFESGTANTPSDRAFHKKGETAPRNAADLWLEFQMFGTQPMQPALSGLRVEYRLVQLYSRDAGKREAKISFNVGQGTQDIGFRNEADVLFTARPAREVVLHVRDENGAPTTAAFLIRDQQKRFYPSLSKRLAPDFAFHAQI